MNTNNLPSRAATKTEIPAKRRRGRPRKDDNIIKRGRPQVPITPASDITMKNIQQQQAAEEVNPDITRIDNNNNNNNIQVGQMVSGVIEGIFDAGYLIAVRVGQSSTIFRGVVFQPGRVVPVTPANDIAPHVKMYQRQEFSLPVTQHAVQNTKQPEEQLVGQSVAPMDANQVLSFDHQPFRPPTESTVVPPAFGNKDTSTSLQGGQIAARENLVMVEQDDVMQVFEVSKPSDVSDIDSGAFKNSKQVTNQGSEILKTGTEFESTPSQLVGPDHGFQEVPSVTNIVIEPQTSELVHQEFKSTTHGPDHPRSVYCRIKPGELTQQEASNTLLEDVVPLEGTSVSLHAEIDNPIEERGVNILIKDGTCCSEKLPLIDVVDDNANCSDELGVEEESSFQGKVDQIQASTSAVQTTDMNFVMEDPAVQITYSGPNDVS